MPPISGKILWSRQLLRHIEEPMEVLKHKQNVLLTTQGKAVVRKYNKVALALTQYEIIYYKSWSKDIDTANKSLQVSRLK